ncbi:MAG: Proline--tRNA ligase [Mycoplasmataceae bacterium]|nr:MAG: Proline--tRNA ligase [Mycoplasmataceae bacterium]
MGNKTMEIDNKKYVRLIEEGGIFFYSLAKGTFILPPNGFVLWDQIKKYLDSKFELLGVKNVTLPTLIPISLLEKEKNHIDGFSPELFLVKRKKLDNHNELENPNEEVLALRPTSEVLFYEWFSKSLQSYKQLPFLYNQWGQVFRAEKNTKPFLRNTEFLWQEGHTLHVGEKDARDFAKQILDIYKEYVEKILCLSATVGIKTSCEKFAGALESYTVECLLPDYQCLQVATSHYFGESFSKAFDVNFRDENNQLNIPSSTSWGTSTRAIGAIVLAHSDELGLIFPFPVAPIQIAFIKYNDNENLKLYENEIYSKLSSKFRCKSYSDSKQIGINLTKADKEGCPIKIIIGSNELESNTLTVSLRTFPKDKFIINKDEIFSFIESSQLKISNYLYQKNLSIKNSHTFKINDYKELTEKIKTEKGIFLVPFCDRSICEINVRKLFPSFSFRCISLSEEIINSKCIFCSYNSIGMAYLGRSY